MNTAHTPSKKDTEIESHLLSRINRTVSICAIPAVVLAVIVSPSAALANSPKLQPHRAVYDLVMDKSVDSNFLSGVQGRYVYEFSGNRCEGYTTNSRFLLKTTNNIGVTNTFDSRSSYFENTEIGSFRFFHRTYLNEKVFEESNGTAERNLQEITVELSSPEEIALNFAKNTLFPTELTMKTISEAQKGTKFMTDFIYDGVEDGQLHYSVSTVIGSSDELSKTDKTSELIDKEILADNRFWPVTYAFFEQGDSQVGEQTPNFQVAMSLHENGVSSDLGIKYRGYGLIGILAGLEALPVYECDL